MNRVECVSPVFYLLCRLLNVKRDVASPIRKWDFLLIRNPQLTPTLPNDIMCLLRILRFLNFSSDFLLSFNFSPLYLPSHYWLFIWSYILLYGMLNEVLKNVYPDVEKYMVKVKKSKFRESVRPSRYFDCPSIIFSTWLNRLSFYVQLD